MQANCQATRPLRSLIPPLCVALIAAGFGALPVNAAGIVGTGDARSCTQGAFNLALVGGGRITFNCGPNPHTILFTLTKPIAANTRIDGGNRITLKAANVIHFAVVSGRKLELVNLRLTDGKSADKGGAVFNRGTLEVQNCTFSLNTAVNGGGAIWNDGGTVNVIASSFDQNQATDLNSSGGAIGSSAGTLTIANSTFSDNSAANGGALNNNGSATAVLSTFFGNVATNLGGAIYNSNNLTVDHSTLTGNQAAGSGGGLAHQGVLLTLIASTVNGNLAFQGGGIYVSGQATLTNSTLSGNQASQGGGGLYHNSGDGSMRFMTIADNFALFGAGFHKEGVGTGVLSLQNTLLSNNADGNCSGAAGQTKSLGNNLSSDTRCGGFMVAPGDQTGIDAKLGPLANNGGPTLTHLPQAGSPAINGAVMVGGITTDQRDVKRPRGPLPDIGAVEAQ